MGNVTSTLTMRMVDGVSGIAKKVQASLKGVDASARKVTGSKALGSAPSGAILAGGGTAVMTALGTYVTGQAAKDAYLRHADFDRRITRIRQTADASAADGERAKVQIRKTADGIGLSVDEVTAGVEALVSAGRSLPDALSFIPSVARAAQASGASVEDMAKTADAIGTSMKITGPEMERAFDVLVTQGKAGKFELKDMAQYLPALAPAAAAVGLKGVEGLNKLAAMLQVIRNQTGSASDAATSMTNIFNKMESDETAKRFSKFGIDLRKEMAKARKSGADLLDVFVDLSDKALKGDLSKIPQLFADQEFSRGMRALLSQRSALQDFIANISKAAGAVGRDLKAPAEDAASAVQRLTNAWDGALRSFGAAADAGGVTAFLRTVGETADGAARDFERLGEIMRAVREFRFGDAAGQTAEFLGGVTDESRREQARGEAMRIGAAIEAEYEKTRKALSERERLDKVMARYPKGEVPAIVQSQSNAVDRALMDANARVDEVTRQLGAALTDAIVQSLPKLQSLEGTPDLSGVEGPRPRLAPGQLPDPPAPNPVRHRIPVAPLDDPTAGLPSSIRQSGDRAVQEAQAVAARIKAAFDAVQPVIRPRVEMPNVGSYALGQRVSDGLNGAQSDTGGRR